MPRSIVPGMPAPRSTWHSDGTAGWESARRGPRPLVYLLACRVAPGRCRATRQHVRMWRIRAGDAAAVRDACQRERRTWSCANHYRAHARRTHSCARSCADRDAKHSTSCSWSYAESELVVSGARGRLLALAVRFARSHGVEDDTQMGSRARRERALHVCIDAFRMCVREGLRRMGHCSHDP